MSDPAAEQPRLTMDDGDAPLFTVGQVASMLGVQQAFLRRLDAERVVQPSRSEGGQRRYSRSEVLRLQKVVGLVAEGITLAGVRRVLDLEQQVTDLTAERDAMLEERDGRTAR